MNQSPNAPNIGSLLVYRRPIINLPPNFQSLVYDGGEKSPMEKSEILPWTKFTFENITNAYGDILEQATNSNRPDEVLEFDCENHSMMVQIFYEAFLKETAISLAISLGKLNISPRFSWFRGTDMYLAFAEAREMKEKLPKRAHQFDFGDEDRFHVLYDANEEIRNPFLATVIVVPSCTWEPDSLVTANRDRKPELGPIEQLAACAKKTNTCLSLILGDKDIVVLQFFKTEAGRMGVY
ncbi:hypothetical protein FPRO05_01228 [Fusarium proliferatum]|uniref:Uncharacterized protein n=1 Tax=Gibberella intermedia TaxID=948311 RepID=A0A365N6Q8_GIBIN|nr:hypothetical protein FPRO05_01228 [Fusarium proliferatum]